MNPFAEIRKRLAMTQAELATPLGVTQSNVSFYENGQTVPPLVARRLIDLARTRDLEITFDEIYASIEPVPPQPLSREAGNAQEAA